MEIPPRARARTPRTILISLGNFFISLLVRNGGGISCLASKWSRLTEIHKIIHTYTCMSNNEQGNSRRNHRWFLAGNGRNEGDFRHAFACVSVKRSVAIYFCWRKRGEREKKATRRRSDLIVLARVIILSEAGSRGIACHQPLRSRASVLVAFRSNF